MKDILPLPVVNSSRTTEEQSLSPIKLNLWLRDQIQHVESCHSACRSPHRSYIWQGELWQLTLCHQSLTAKFPSTKDQITWP